MTSPLERFRQHEEKIIASASWDRVIAFCGLARLDFPADVLDDFKARDELGAKRYGDRLHAFNGRDALLDAYEEAMDLVVYLQQAADERALDELEIVATTGTDDKPAHGCALNRIVMTRNMAIEIAITLKQLRKELK